MKTKNCLYIDNEKLRLKKTFIFIKETIKKTLNEKGKIIIFTDNLFFNETHEIFDDEMEVLFENINKENIFLEICDDYEMYFDHLLKLVNNIYSVNNNILVIWNVNNIQKYEIYNRFKKLISCFEHKNIKNLVYIKNKKYNFDTFYNFSKSFEQIVIYNNNKELIFNEKEDFYKAINFICSYGELKHQNENLLFFNNVMTNIPMNYHKDDFQKNIMSKLIELWDLNFCCIYVSSKEHENIIALDNYYGITKEHKYYLVNDEDIISFQIDINNKIKKRKNSIYIDVDDINNKKVREKFLKLSIKEMIGVYVEYHNYIEGVIWVGKYKDSGVNIEKDLDYIESMCKTVFSLTQEQRKFFNLRNKFIENEKLKNMGEMAAGIAHDINNILTPIIGSVELLKDKYNEDKVISKQLKVIEMCTYDVTNIISKLKKLTVSCSSNDMIDIFNVNEVILDAIALTKNKWLNESILDGVKINIFTNLDSNERIQGNITEIREVIINIISNAVDAIEKDGQIRISTVDKDDYVVIEIEDNGVGINEGIENRIFQPFFTTKGKKGSGLGLSIAYKIIQSIGGNIRCKSAKNKGTKFIIKVPICNIKKIEENKSHKKIGDSFSKNVLVIDDNKDVRNVLLQIIKSVTQCKVKTCDVNSLEDVEMELSRRKYDIVICDFSMPNINGLEVARKVKELDKNTYFCLMTGWIGNLNEEKMIFVDEILSKPLTREVIENLFVRYENMYSLS
ncbi:hybrid sensor histidine kinase/response regulator [Clostridium massiliodielmoense]|uniref:ATP-binding response regulator n=1 Tax=Clostridium massiliodielmoense TaxID=1776385 RepID=UPI0004D80A43|nr:hybrid sensor histidine kinase/response regulator [Clostridium massiliodielmoense]KEH95644.1 histidine kinase [Clostridium botulinum C/D str. BKT12695]